MNTLEGLLAMRELLAVPERWTKGVIARDAAGCATANESASEAVCWCLVGAMKLTAPKNRDLWPVWRAVEAQIPNHWQPSRFNDHPDTTHADVLAVIDKAISSERAKASAS